MKSPPSTFEKCFVFCMYIRNSTDDLLSLPFILWMKEVVCLVHHRLKEVFAKESTTVTRDRALTMTKTSKKEKKGSITMRGRVEYKRKVEERKEEKGALHWLHKAKLQRTYLKRNDLLMAVLFLKYSALSMILFTMEKSFRWTVKDNFPETFSKNEHPQPAASTWVTYQILTTGWEQKEMFGWYRPYSSQLNQRPTSLFIMYVNFSLFLDDRYVDF